MSETDTDCGQFRRYLNTANRFTDEYESTFYYVASIAFLVGTFVFLLYVISIYHSPLPGFHSEHIQQNMESMGKTWSVNMAAASGCISMLTYKLSRLTSTTQSEDKRIQETNDTTANNDL